MVVEDIINRGISVRGERREVTILFADLIGFTAMSEQLEPEWVVRVLNGYFRAMSQAVTRHNGHVAKFMGDGIMALFGAPEPNPWQTMDAVRAALEMRNTLAQYNDQLRAEEREPLTIAVGVHVGPVVAGVVGSTQLVEYTVIGDVVNTASRIERLTRHFGKDILISAAVQQRIDDRFVVRAMEPVAVKGKSELLQTFAVDTYREDSQAPAPSHEPT
ncbi:MAG: adenylate/guanylate cyclase domain-containing protein [Candidatus Binatia bacterium]